MNHTRNFTKEMPTRIRRPVSPADVSELRAALPQFFQSASVDMCRDLAKRCKGLGLHDIASEADEQVAIKSAFASFSAEALAKRVAAENSRLDRLQKSADDIKRRLSIVEATFPNLKSAGAGTSVPVAKAKTPAEVELDLWRAGAGRFSGGENPMLNGHALHSRSR
jgi:hypothetical protein